MIDLSELALRGKLARATTQGPGPTDDASVVTTGVVYEVNDADGTVRVGVRGGAVWLPAVAGRYHADSLARILIDPTAGRPVLVIGPVRPRKPAEIAGVKATSGGTVTITLRDQDYVIPAPIGTYTVGQSAWVLLDDWGGPVIAIGPSTTPAPGYVPPAGPGTGGTVTATATIGPQVSGTWSVRYNRWDTYNTNRYGGASDIYQGSGFNNFGILRGFAGYGDQIANLGALSIEEIILAARKTSDGLTAALTVQGSPHGGRPGGAPASSGDTTSSAPIGSGANGALAFTAAMREAFRTGAAKGLVAVGGQYGGFGGTATPGSFVLTVRYTKKV